MDEKAWEFGQYLRKLRNAKGFTLTELGDLIGVSNPYLSQIENGKRGIPSAELLQKLSVPLEVDFLQLLDHAWKVKLEKKVIPDTELYNYDLINLLQDEKVNLRGNDLTNEDRKRILQMLELLFPEKKESLYFSESVRDDVSTPQNEGEK